MVLDHNSSANPKGIFSLANLANSQTVIARSGLCGCEERSKAISNFDEEDCFAKDARNDSREGSRDSRIRMSLFVSILLALVVASPSAAAPQRAKIDPRVLQDTASDQSADFLVILKSQANVRAASASTFDRVARGRAVFTSLRQAADSTQSAVRAQLDALGVEYRVYWIANLIAVKGNRAVVDALAARRDVAEIESDRAFRVELPKPEESPKTFRVSTGIAWNVSQVNAPALWAKGYTGQGSEF